MKMKMKSVHRRQASALQAAAFKSSFSPASEQTGLVLPRFHLDLWLCFTIQNWFLDIGRLIVMLSLPADMWPLNQAGAPEFLHILYNMSSPLLLLQMLERSGRLLPRPAVHLSIIAVTMGTSFHLVADSVIQQLVLIGYQLHLSIRENPVMKKLEPPSLVDAFELLFYYEDTMGHVMWYAPLFLILFIFFSSCFKKHKEAMPLAAWGLLFPNIVYYWYLITEGQTFILFIFTFFTMTATVIHQRRRGLFPDCNGLFMLFSFSAALVLVAVWVACLWNDGVLRRKHPGLIYIPQPRAVYTLYLRQNYT
ncbi:ceroid-lipofuscinosis neuronal protein 6 homolog [Antennarius striatus]|uniref:ceroid-lipofuscinosis neuronal protein 6 homolog n=1 Tax=Antennarius striatus TaxID=241820 RepID=UPI0035AF47CB